MAIEDEFGNQVERMQSDIGRVVDRAHGEGVDLKPHLGRVEDIVHDVRSLRGQLKTTKERNAAANAVGEEVKRILRESGQ